MQYEQGSSYQHQAIYPGMLVRYTCSWVHRNEPKCKASMLLDCLCDSWCSIEEQKEHVGIVLLPLKHTNTSSFFTLILKLREPLSGKYDPQSICHEIIRITKVIILVPKPEACVCHLYNYVPYYGHSYWRVSTYLLSCYSRTRVWMYHS